MMLKMISNDIKYRYILANTSGKKLEGKGKASAFYPVLLHILNLFKTFD